MFEIVCGIKVRANNAFDRNIVQAVIAHNRYRLPERFQKEDVILDIGAHVGSFSYACLLRGAGRVHAFEPDEENFQICAENLKEFAERVILHNTAVWRSDVMDTPLLYTGPSESLERLNYGGGNVVFGDGRQIPVKSEPLDWVLSNIRTVRLMKLDCEASEWPILFSCRLLECVDAIVGEYHEIVGKRSCASIPLKAKLAGFETYTVEALVSFLNRHAFSVEILGKPDSNIGSFFARSLSK
jgi:FkbM family methyltransferase